MQANVSIRYKCPECSTFGAITHEPFKCCPNTQSELYSIQCHRCKKVLMVQHKNGSFVSWLKEEQKIQQQLLSNISLPVASEVYVFFAHIPTTSNIEVTVKNMKDKIEELNSPNIIIGMSERTKKIVNSTNDKNVIILPEETFFMNSAFRIVAPLAEAILLSLNNLFIVKKAFATFYTINKEFETLDFQETKDIVEDKRINIGVKL